jgi:hypothetical protein
MPREVLIQITGMTRQMNLNEGAVEGLIYLFRPYGTWILVVIFFLHIITSLRDYLKYAYNFLLPAGTKYVQVNSMSRQQVA